MQLGNFEPHTQGDGDRLQAKEAVDKPFIVLVREHRTGIVTQYKPQGGDGVVVDVANVATNEVWLGVLWMNGAIVDNLAPYVGQPVAIKLVWVPSAKGGNPYIGVKALEGQELALAQQWAAANSNRFDLEKQQRAAQAAQFQQPVQPAGVPAVTAPPVAPAPAPAPASVVQQPVPAAAPAAPAAPVNVNDPAVQALLAQIAGGQAPPSA